MGVKREPFEMEDEDLAQRLGEMAHCYGNPTVPGWKIVKTWEEGSKHGFSLYVVFHRDGEPTNEGWETSFDIQREEVYIWGKQKFYPRTRVVRKVETTAWE